MFPWSTLYSFGNCHQSSSTFMQQTALGKAGMFLVETEGGKEVCEVIKKRYNFISCQVSDLIFKYLASGTQFCYCSANLLTLSKIIHMYQRNVGLLIVNNSDTKEKPQRLISSSQVKVVNIFHNISSMCPGRYQTQSSCWWQRLWKQKLTKTNENQNQRGKHKQWGQGSKVCRVFLLFSK